MKLLIDAGNTNIVFAVSDGAAIIKSWRCATDAGKRADDYAAWLQGEGFDAAQIKESVFCSVVPDVDNAIIAFCTRHCGGAPFIINHKNAGIEIKLDRPEQAGADRLVNAVAVRAFYSHPAVVVDFGTATTFDVIDESGAFCGGVIAPGVNLSAKALHDAAAKLPQVDIKKPPAVIGTDTVGAMQSGLYWGYVALIEGMLARIENEMGVKPFVIATGGLSGLFAGDIPAIEKTDKELTLRGMLHILEAKQANQAA